MLCNNSAVALPSMANMPRINFVLPLAMLVLVAGCAPDAMNNRAATGFNGYLNTIGRDCSPLLLGGQEMSEALQTGAGDNNYNYWLDVTSKLYYNTMSPASYREAVTAFFGAGYDRAIDCTIAKLPATR
jgi:hypothetical protein